MIRHIILNCKEIRRHFSLFEVFSFFVFFLILSPTHNLYTDNIKVQYLQFMAYMKTPQYRTNLQQLLEQEKVMNNASADISDLRG